MSGIASIGSMSEYLPPKRSEDESERIEPFNQPSKDDELQAPVVKASAQQLAEKTTVQGFQYTGKGSFIDKVF